MISVDIKGNRMPATPQEKIEALIAILQGLEIAPGEAAMLCLTVAVRITDTHAQTDRPTALVALTETLNVWAPMTIDAIYGTDEGRTLQ